MWSLRDDHLNCQNESITQIFGPAKMPTTTTDPPFRRYLEYDTNGPESDDDSRPYFGFLHSMPNDWSWRRAYTFATERFLRMKQQCNGYGTTIESLFTTFIERTFIICVCECMMTEDEVIYIAYERTQLKLKYFEFFSLPVAFYCLHPL
jgi:hypothetical protein